MNMKSLLSASAIATVVLVAGQADAGTFTLERTFDDPTVTVEAIFGSSVAIDGNHVLIGAPWHRKDETQGSEVGQVHLFDATTGLLLHNFDNPNGTLSVEFGNSVAIDGNHVLIGARADDTQGTNVGQAHLFDATTGLLLHTFDDPTVTARDFFGNSVAIDGNHVLIGAPLDGTQGSEVGQAHLFDATTGALLHTFDDPTLTVSAFFGGAVAIDGNHVLIGAQGDGTQGFGVGQAHLFDATTGLLLHTFDDPTVTTGDRFGGSVAIDGNHVLIGAQGDDTQGSEVGQAHLFDAITGLLLHTFDDPTVTGSDLFGNSVAIDGNHVLIGAYADDTHGSEVGQAHLFDATTGFLLHTFDDPTVTIPDLFGSSVAIDGNHVLIGAQWDSTQGPLVGQAHLFTMAPVPVPPGFALLAPVMLGLGFVARRRARR